MTAPTTERKIPARSGNSSGDQTKGIGVGLNVGTSITRTEDIPTLDTMNARGQRIATAYYESGVTAGIEMGRRLAEEEMAALWRQAHAVVQHAARQPTYADLCERRGEPQRAERHRQLLRTRGLAA